MTSVVALYDALTTAPDERTRARLIAEAFERLEERYPHLADLATKGHLREMRKFHFVFGLGDLTNLGGDAV